MIIMDDRVGTKPITYFLYGSALTIELLGYSIRNQNHVTQIAPPVLHHHSSNVDTSSLRVKMSLQKRITR